MVVLPRSLNLSDRAATISLWSWRQCSSSVFFFLFFLLLMGAAATHRRERTHQQCSKIWTQQGDVQFDIYAHRCNFECSIEELFFIFQIFQAGSQDGVSSSRCWHWRLQSWRQEVSPLRGPWMSIHMNKYKYKAESKRWVLQGLVPWMRNYLSS